ncbi:hypothetical protein GALMADRAFT_1141441 [Galerina marginata CBS 339.88]|uniref:C2H2-type domain-containing protein n=1 Tax=Galerina marginata (strain CBS 339.88) TaxID=685588 RepID=A0A067SA72_GALM3|nr:hypothetical protein GALMADRAFT_1141441 [Galerina marginata CBS 339.88]
MYPQVEHDDGLAVSAASTFCCWVCGSFFINQQERHHHRTQQHRPQLHPQALSNTLLPPNLNLPPPAERTPSESTIPAGRRPKYIPSCLIVRLASRLLDPGGRCPSTLFIFLTPVARRGGRCGGSIIINFVRLILIPERNGMLPGRRSDWRVLTRSTIIVLRAGRASLRPGQMLGSGGFWNQELSNQSPNPLSSYSDFVSLALQIISSHST